MMNGRKKVLYQTNLLSAEDRESIVIMMSMNLKEYDGKHHAPRNFRKMTHRSYQEQTTAKKVPLGARMPPKAGNPVGLRIISLGKPQSDYQSPTPTDNSWDLLSK